MSAWINATTIGDMLDKRAAERPRHEALVFPDSRYTFEELAARAAGYSRGLLALGVRPGDRVGYFMHESPDQMAILFGVAKIGAVLVPVNARFKLMELRQVVVHSGISVLFTSRSPEGTDHAALLTARFPELAGADPRGLDMEAVPELKGIVYLGAGDPEPGMLTRTQFEQAALSVDLAAVASRQLAVRLRDTAMIVYTSGTTAAPKGAVLTHESFSRSAQAVVASRLEVNENSKMWTMLPMFHVGGLAFAVGSAFTGATLVHTGYFDPATALQQLREENCTHGIPGFDLFWKQVLTHPDLRQGDLDSLIVILCVGAEESIRQLQQQTPRARLVTNTGMTESCGFIAVSSPQDPLDSRMTSSGMPFPGNECEIHDPETGELLPWGGTGELWYRGPCQFDGYFRDPELNAQVIDERGFFRTGDLIRTFEDGRIVFVSRVKDMLKVGGENVSAAEVEGFLLTHPAVRVVQVVAAPDEKYGEVPAAYIELSPDAAVTEEQIIDFCKGNIATFRIPRYVRFVNEWPISGTKIKKHVLRTQIAEELSQA